MSPKTTTCGSFSTQTPKSSGRYTEVSCRGIEIATSTSGEIACKSSHAIYYAKGSSSDSQLSVNLKDSERKRLISELNKKYSK